MRSAKWWTLGAAVMLGTWAVLLFAVHVPSGWIHLALVGGVLATVRAIVLHDAERHA